MREKVTLEICEENQDLWFVKQKYQNNGNLAIQVIAEDKEYGGYEPWCMLTVNIPPYDLPNNQAFLDTNNCSEEIIAWLYKNDYVREIGLQSSGYCMYPLVEFTEEFMQMLVEQ